MSSKAAITVLRQREELERLWRDPRYPHPHADSSNAQVRFVSAPGDRGTEIHVELRQRGGAGKLPEGVQRLLGIYPLAKVKDDLRRFKQLVETGVIARSDAVPEGERLERKLRQRPAQPLKDDELRQAVA